MSKKFGSWTKQETSVFTTSGDAKDVTITPAATLTGASLTLTLPDLASGIADTLVSVTSTATLTNKTIAAGSNTISGLVHGTEVDNPSSGVHGVTGSVVGTSDSQTLTNKTIDGDNNTISDIAITSLKTEAGDASKFIARDVSGAVVSVNQVPAGNVVGTTDGQTLTNKTITVAGGNTISGLLHGTQLDNPSSGVHGVTGTIVGTSDTQTLTNKTIDFDNNTITNIDNANVKSGAAIALDKLASVAVSKAVVSSASGVIETSNTTAAQIAFLSTVSSNVQDQLNNKQADVVIAEGDVIVGNGSGAAARLAIGGNGTVLSSNGTTASWVAAGAGDVTSTGSIASNRIVIGDTGGKDVKQSGVTISGLDDMTGVFAITMQGALSGVTDLTMSGDLTVDTSTFVVDSGSNRVGVGIAAPEGKLHVRTTDSNGTAATTADELILDNNGDCGLTILSGTSSEGNIYFGDAGSSSRGWMQYDHSDNSLRFGSNGAERIRIGSTGRMGFGTTSVSDFIGIDAGTVTGDHAINATVNANAGGTPAYKYTQSNVNNRHVMELVQGTAPSNGHYMLRCTSLNTANIDPPETLAQIMGDGDLENKNNSYGGLSDATLKENISAARNYLSDLNQVQVRRFSFISARMNEANQLGVIAQELEAIFPSMVRTDEETGLKSVKYSIFVPMLITAVQDLSARVAALEV